MALVSAWRAQSPALLAFGADSLVELLSATVVLFQFLPRFTLSQAPADRWAGILLVVLAAVVSATSVLALTGSVAALITKPILSGAKRRTSRRLHSSALAADAVHSATCAYLATITLLGLALNAALALPWIDPAAALVVVPLLCLEGRRALRGEACGCG